MSSYNKNKEGEDMNIALEKQDDNWLSLLDSYKNALNEKGLNVSKVSTEDEYDYDSCKVETVLYVHSPFFKDADFTESCVETIIDYNMQKGFPDYAIFFRE